MFPYVKKRVARFSGHGNSNHNSCLFTYWKMLYQCSCYVWKKWKSLNLAHVGKYFFRSSSIYYPLKTCSQISCLSCICLLYASTTFFSLQAKKGLKREVTFSQKKNYFKATLVRQWWVCSAIAYGVSCGVLCQSNYFRKRSYDYNQIALRFLCNWCTGRKMKHFFFSFFCWPLRNHFPKTKRLSRKKGM